MHATWIQFPITECGQRGLAPMNDGAQAKVCMPTAQAGQLGRLFEHRKHPIAQLRDVVGEGSDLACRSTDLDADDIAAFAPREACFLEIRNVRVDLERIDPELAAIRGMHSHPVWCLLRPPSQVVLQQNQLDLVPGLDAAILGQAIVDQGLHNGNDLRCEELLVELGRHRCSEEASANRANAGAYKAIAGKPKADSQNTNGKCVCGGT